MKKIYTTILMIGMLFGLAQTTKAETYKAWGAVLFPYISTPMYDDGETLEVTADSIFFSSATWGDGAFGSATGEGVLAMANHRTGGITKYAADITGSVEDGYVITVPSVMGGTVITITIGEMPVLANVAGAFDAWGAVLFAYIKTPMIDEGEKLTVTTDSIFFTSATWGEGKFAATATANEDGGFSVTGAGTLTMSGHGQTKDYAADITGTVTDSTKVFVIAVPSVMGGTNITVTIGELPTVHAVSGTYKGGIYANAAYFKNFQPTADQSVTITANEDLQTVNVSFTNETWGTFTYESVPVTKNEDGSYTLEGEGNCAMPSMQDPTVINNYASDFKGTLTDGTLVAEFFVNVMGGTTILFNPEDFEAVSVKSVITEQDKNTKAPTYNLSGVRVDASYKGIVIKNGKKYLQH